MKSSTLKAKLATLSFFEFAIWGTYLVSMGMFLYHVGLGQEIFLFYMVQGLVSLFMPAVMGIVADRWLPAQKTLALCHFIAAIFMFAAGYYAMSVLPEGWIEMTHEQLVGYVDFGTIFTLYTISVAFYMPTIGLNNSVAFNALERGGLDTVKDFPPIRVFGTVGFIVAELMVNFVEIDGITLQKSYTQFFATGAFGIIMALYALTMPKCPVNKS
ncbi:MAG TPA: MFS transporter, partial [Muribaculaceae bacterium]|nr:MFS transporter [Muribaculaceae bacterium]